jgi:hypothetical protein
MRSGVLGLWCTQSDGVSSYGIVVTRRIHLAHLKATAVSEDGGGQWLLLHELRWRRTASPVHLWLQEQDVQLPCDLLLLPTTSIWLQWWWKVTLEVSLGFDVLRKLQMKFQAVEAPFYKGFHPSS